MTTRIDTFSNDPFSERNNIHHTSEYLREQDWNNPDLRSPFNGDNCEWYPGQMGYLADGQPIVHQWQLDSLKEIG